MKKTSSKQRPFKNNKIVVIGVLLLVLVVGGTLLSVKLIDNNTSSNTTPSSQPGVSTPIKNTPSPAGEAPNSPSNNSSSSSSTASSTQASQSNPSTNLVTPFGSFVSNHHPNLSGSPSPNTEQSVCETTPGATCKVTFTSAGVTKSLNAQLVDANGEALWNWTVQNVGLTQGSWQITATATLGGQSKSTNDTLLLVVSP